MKAVFVGGGSFRTLPIVRGAMSEKKVFDGGEISLVDFNLQRAEAVGRMIMKTPEYRKIKCKVSWTDKLEKALPGADMVSAGFPVVPYEVEAAGIEASFANGFMGTDQLSINGAFRAMGGGIIINDIARKMEKLCPSAWLLIFANPVSVYSGFVNNHTKIKALGICGSCYHHRWEMSRILYGIDKPLDEYKVASAGVNHLTFMLRGEHKGKDLYKLLARKFSEKNWKPYPLTTCPSIEKSVHKSHYLYREMWRRFGYVPNANEHDGLAHVFYDELFRNYYLKAHKPQTLREIRAQGKLGAEYRKKQDTEFCSHLDKELDEKFWATSYLKNNTFGACNIGDPTVSVLKALGTGKAEWLSASLPNRGVLPGFKDRTVVDYSFKIDRKGIHPDADLEVPNCFHGLIGALATHQTLLGDAIATRDPQIFAEALYAYPIRQNSAEVKALWRELLGIYKDVIPSELQDSKNYF